MSQRPSPIAFASAIAGSVALWTLACSAPIDVVATPSSPPGGLLIRHVAVFDVVAGQMRPDRDVLVRGDRIAAIALGGELDDPGDAVEIDGRGASLLPGLIDVHGHVGANRNPSWLSPDMDVESNLQSYLYSGVTTVLDPGMGSQDVFAVRDQVARGELLGPKIYAARRFITAPGGHPVKIIETVVPSWLGWYLRRSILPDLLHQVSTAEEGAHAANEEVSVEPDFIKLIVDRIPQSGPRIENEALAAAVATARKHGVRAVAHIGTTEDAVDAGRAGVAAWVHGVYKEAIPEEQIPELVAFGIPMAPTTVIWESYANARRLPRRSSALEREVIPAETLAGYNQLPSEETDLARVFDPWLALVAERRDVWADNVRRLHEAGVVMLAGSDAQSGVFAGPGLHRELQLLAAAGLTPAEVLRAATLDPARFLARSNDPDFGVIEVGKRADLLLVEGDPTTDLAAVSRIRDVILGGVRLERTPVAAE
jgi:imidazolonepropionase-like amidohydrolase